MKIGDKLRGTITGIQPYGAFVELESGITGLIHISEIKTGYIENIHDLLAIGDSVQVQVLDFDEYTKKASLSMRTLEEEKHRLPKRHRFSNDRHKFGFAPLAKSIPTWTEEALQFLSNQKDEKENHPEHKTTGGYLKIRDNSDCCIEWWKGLTDKEKAIIKAIPNFDSEKFYKITGIKVEGG